MNSTMNATSLLYLIRAIAADSLRGCKRIIQLHALERRYGCHISRRSMFTGPLKSISIGRNTTINAYANFRFKEGRIRIGSNVLVAQFVTILAHSYNYENRDRPIAQQGMYAKDVEIGDDVWIGVHAVIMPGVKIGTGAVIGANAVVTRDVPAYEVWAGAPARKIKERGAALPHDGR